MSAPDLSYDEEIALSVYETRPWAPEAFRNVLARALFMYDTRHPEDWDQMDDDTGWHDEADYILTVVRGETDGVWSR